MGRIFTAIRFVFATRHVTRALRLFQRTGDTKFLNDAATAWEIAFRRPLFRGHESNVLPSMLALGCFVYEHRFLAVRRRQDSERLVTLSREALACARPESTERALSLGNLGNALRYRCEATENNEDLDESIRICKEAVELAPQGSAERPGILSILAAGLLDRHGRRKDAQSSSDLEEAIRLGREATELERPGLPVMPETWNELGNALHQRYVSTRDPSDLDESIDCCRKALQFTPSGNLAGLPYLQNIIDRLRSRYNQLGQPADLTESIDAGRNYVRLAPLDSPERLRQVANLGASLFGYFELGGPREVLDEGISCCRQAVESFPPDSLDRAISIGNIGLGLLFRFEAAANPADLKDSIEHLHQAVELTPDNGGDHVRHLGNLGLGLVLRYRVDSNVCDLTEAIRLLRLAVESAPLDSPELIRQQANLGMALRDEYAATSDIATLKEAISLLTHVTQCPTDGLPLIAPISMTNLSAALRDLYLAIGDISDVDQALGIIDSMMEQGSWPPKILAKISLGSGDLLMARYAAIGDIADLHEAVRVLRQSLNYVGDTSVERPVCMDALGAAFLRLYETTGRVGDLEESVNICTGAVKLTPQQSADRPRHLANLGSCLARRYNQTRNRSDLEKATESLREAVNASPRAAVGRPSCLSNLSNVLSDGYALTGDTENLQESNRLLREAIGLTAHECPAHNTYLANLGMGLRDLYIRTGNKTILTEAIDLSKQAVDRSPKGSPERSNYLNALGLAWAISHWKSRNDGELTTALKCYEDAVADCPTDSPIRLGFLNNLGIALLTRYRCTQDINSLEKCIDALEQVFVGTQTMFADLPIPYRIGQFGKHSELHSFLSEAHLFMASVQPSGGASSTRRAFEVAEAAKSRLLHEMIGRRDLPTPQTISDEQGSRENLALSSLAALDSLEFAALGRQPGRDEESASISRLESRKTCLKELQITWSEMEAQGPEAAEYVALRRAESLKWSDFASLAKKLGPDSAVVSLMICESSTKLFVLREGLSLQSFDSDLGWSAWSDVSQRFFREIHDHVPNDRRRETWDLSVQSLLKLATPHLNGAKRIVFAPYSIGHLIPWSIPSCRAGWPQSNSTPLPIVTVPALALLPRLLSHEARSDGDVLVVGDPQRNLKNAAVEAREVASVLGTTPLVGEEATKRVVLEQLPLASVAHFATHARFAAGSPLDSGIILADGVLTARELVLHRCNADLVVLSACETGMAGSLGGEQLAGLAQAFLLAGVKSLVVSLWSVDDLATSVLMAEFYRARMAGSDKGQALVEAMAAVKSRPEWSHPYFWGPFVLMGDWE